MSNNLKEWLILEKIPDLGNARLKMLWDYFGSAQKIIGADEVELEKVEGIFPRLCRLIVENREKIKVDNELSKLSGVPLLTLDDENYPRQLKNIYDPPSILYLRRSILPADEKAIAIVGTRKASHYGTKVTRQLAGELASLGITIVSGMAMGIDAAAHAGALGSSGRTIAVLGCGVDVVYPAENKMLMDSIIGNGAVVSEYPPGTQPEGWRFPQRNRIISGLSLGVIVVEGSYDSGAMITAKLALEQNREVFAIPGNVEADQSKGPHWLIKQGAKLVESIEDVFDELKSQIQNPKSKIGSRSLPCRQAGQIPRVMPGNLSPEEEKIYSALSIDPKHIDLISAETGFPIYQVSSILMQLEMRRAVVQLPGKRFVVG